MPILALKRRPIMQTAEGEGKDRCTGGQGGEQDSPLHDKTQISADL